MIQLARLTILRQRRVAEALTEAQNDPTFVAILAQQVRDALANTVTAGAGLDMGHAFPPLMVDASADAVFGAFEANLSSVVRGMNDHVVAPLPAEPANKKAAAALILARVYPRGVEFLSKSMPLQYDAMAEVVHKLRTDQGCVSAVQELGLGWFVDHMEAHLAPYGHCVKTSDDRDLEAAGAKFHAAYTNLVVQVAAHHPGDEQIAGRLENAYKTEVEAQREEERNARAKSRKKKAAKAAAANAGAPLTDAMKAASLADGAKPVAPSAMAIKA